MADLEQSTTIVNFIKAIGPYLVAIAGTAFGYLQSKQVAQIAKEKDLEIANIQKRSNFEIEIFKNRNLALLKLQEIYIPIYAKVESIIQTYISLVSASGSPSDIKRNLADLLADDYMSFSVEIRKKVLAEAIVIFQVLQDQKAYENAVKLDNKISEALSLLDFKGNSSGSEHTEEIKKIKREYGILYVALFYGVANLSKAANRSSNADEASGIGT